MYNNILLLLSGLLNVIGTVYAVLAVLRLTPKDLHYSITCSSLENRNFELLIQRAQARMGIVLIIIAWLFQVIFTFLTIDRLKYFLVALAVMIFLSSVVAFVIHCLNKRFIKKYDEYEKSLEN